MNENDWVILHAIDHPMRREILKQLREKKALSFNELLRCVDVGNHGRLGFHLRALGGLVEHKPTTNKYQLTDRGKMGVSLIEDIQFLARIGRKSGELINYVRNIVLGDHALLLYDTERFKHEMSFSFLKEGLTKRQAAVYIVSDNKLDSESREAQKHGVGLDQIDSGAFTILPAYEWYIRKGKAQAKTIMNNWLALFKEKQKAGFEGLRVAAETEWFFENAKSKELLRYERMLAQKFPSTVCGICLYSTHSLDENQLVQLAQWHNHVIDKQMVWKTKQSR